MKKPAIRKIGSLLALIIWVVCAVIASQLFVGYPMIWLLGTDTLSQPLWSAVYSTLAYLVALLLIIFVPQKFLKKSRTNRESLGLTNTPTWTDIGLAPIGFIVSLLLGAALVAVFNLFPWFNAAEAQDVGFNYLSSGTDRIIAFAILVIIAPIIEEIIFRGWLYDKLRKRTGVICSILLTSLAFAVVHLQWNVGVNVFALSVVLCGLREVTGTIYSGILTHMIKNGVAFYLLYIIGIS